MKKLKVKACALGLSVMLLFTGCADKGTLGELTEGETALDSKDNIISDSKSEAPEAPKDELIPIATVREGFTDDSNTLKAQTFDNISFADTYFTFPSVENVNIIEYKITDYNISPDTAYNYMCGRMDELLPGVFSDEEKAEEIVFFDVDDNILGHWPTFEEYKTIEDRNYPYILTDHPTTGIVGNKSYECYMEISNGFLWSYDNGFLARQCEFDRNIASFDPLDQKKLPVIYRTENIESQRVFHLSSGDISIAEAVKSAEKLLSEFELSERDDHHNVRIQNVNVLDIGNNCCAFSFGIVPEYKNMEYSCILPDSSVYGFELFNDDTNELQACGEAVMCENDKICRYRMLNPAMSYDIVEKDSSSSVVPLKKAAETASEYLTAGINFKALSVSAVYKSFSDKDKKSYDNYAEYEKRKVTLKPCWRFVLQPLTGNTERMYYVFVDMLTGKPYDTVQSMQSEVKYD